MYLHNNHKNCAISQSLYHKWKPEEEALIIKYCNYEWEYKRIARKMGMTPSSVINRAYLLRKAGKL